MKLSPKPEPKVPQGEHNELQAPPKVVPVQAVPDAAPLAAVVDAGAPSADSDVDPEENEDLLLAHAEADIDQKVIGDEPDDVADVPAKPKAPAAPHKPAAKPPTTMVVSVRIFSRPAGAVVKLRQRVFGRAPLSLRFKAGMSYELSFVKAGYVPLKKKLVVSRKKNQSLTVTLRRHTAKTKKNFIQRMFGL